MNVDEAMKYAAGYEEDAEQEEGLLAGERVAIALATEVERLRAELAAMKAELEDIQRENEWRNG
jgi:hypothetical protein